MDETPHDRAQDAAAHDDNGQVDEDRADDGETGGDRPDEQDAGGSSDEAPGDGAQRKAEDEEGLSHEWVLAAPFRAHLLRVHAETRLPLPALALQAGLPLALVDHLVHGRRGRRMHRIPPAAARRLLALGPATFDELAERRIEAAPTARRVGELLAGGLSPTTLASLCRLTPSELAAVGSRYECSALTALLVRAAYQSSGRVAIVHRPDRPLAA
jgi:hypothetical protein